MVRNLKTRRQKKYNYDKNRKNLKKKLKSTGKIKCPEIKNAMDKRRTLTTNIDDMGLAFDVNKSLGLPNSKRDRIKFVKKLQNGFVEEDQTDSENENESKTELAPKHEVVEKLERDAKELRESKFRLPKGQVKFISYLIDKYGLNYKKMVKDHKNYDQETWRQLRAKCRKFMSIPEQFSKYLEERNLVDCEINPLDPQWQETNTDIEDE
ncbi:CLUMA_CG008378, isoform A [Clunio marinus]|uniref:Nucleolar protein 16 n=1 Tax=Clunio marinus TaxID=568069 RepID=A0A1J1I7F7_9DIPT|nr:CLUMA_CG008378, isoform A [Clunio marinus]